MQDFVFHAPEGSATRALSLLARLKEKIWTERRPVQAFAAAPSEHHLSWEEAVRLDFEPLPDPPPPWGKLYDQRWFRLEIAVGENNTPLWLQWSDSGEANLWIDGNPYWGFDWAHQHVALPPECRVVHVEALCSGFGLFPTTGTAVTPAGRLASMTNSLPPPASGTAAVARRPNTANAANFTSKPTAASSLPSFA